MSNKDSDLKVFHLFLARLQNGAINDLLTEAMQKAIEEVSNACMDRGGKHKSTVTFKIDFIMSQKDRILEIDCDINEKHPKVPLGRVGVFFVGNDFFPAREDARQMTLEDELARKRLSDAERAMA
jgi:hypothetical protein